jgi:hypothetical protein
VTGAAADTFVIETTEQLRAVSDPLRQRLLRIFADGSTVKEAAAALGQPLTKLYHHVDQLLAAGLIRVAGEERKRSVVERRFQTVAARFIVGAGALGAGGTRAGKRDEIARGAIEELLAAAADEEGSFRLMRSRARLGQAALERIEAEIARLIDELGDPGAPQVELVVIAARTRAG